MRWASVGQFGELEPVGLWTAPAACKGQVELEIKLCPSIPYLTTHMWWDLVYRGLMFWLLYWLNILLRKNILKLIPIDFFEVRGRSGRPVSDCEIKFESRDKN